MDNNLPISNDVYNNCSNEYKICAGKGCNNTGIHHLKINFINKNGWFCNYCKDDLIKSKLIKEDE